jgi:hypothetical protein
MTESQQPAGSKQYTIGDVGAGARVIQGDYNTWIEGQLGALPGGQELARRFEALIGRLESTEEFDDDDTRTLAVDKTAKVVEGLAQASESPGKLRLALTDAKGFLIGAADWAWAEIKAIVSSEAAQKTLSTIADVGAKAAIAALVGIV